MASGDKRERPFVVGAGVSKRSNYGQGSATARVTPHRLIDDEFAFLLIEDTLAASRAKTKGWIHSRVLAPNEYAEMEAQLVELVRDQEDLQELSEEMIVAALPALATLEAETLQVLLSQYERHMRYEVAARRLAALEAQKDVAKVSRSLKSEASALAHEWESECKRVQALYEEREQEMRMEMAQAVQHARLEAEEERKAQQDQFKVREEHLLADIVSHSAACVEAERKASDANNRAADAVLAAERAQAASDLKRECSQKLKEEVIENDKLTLATLNRIKMLEADLELSRRELEQARREEGVRAREMTTLKEQAAETEQMRAALRHREEASLRLSERMQAMAERLDYFEQVTKQKQIDEACVAAAGRSLQERGQLGPIGSPPPADGYKSGASCAYQESPARRDSFFDRISASNFGLSRQSVLGLDL